MCVNRKEMFSVTGTNAPPTLYGQVHSPPPSPPTTRLTKFSPPHQAAAQKTPPWIEKKRQGATSRAKSPGPRACWELWIVRENILGVRGGGTAWYEKIQGGSRAGGGRGRTDVRNPTRQGGYHIAKKPTYLRGTNSYGMRSVRMKSTVGSQPSMRLIVHR